MLTCDNCNGSFFNDPEVPGLILRHGEKLVAAICPSCLAGVAVAKVVVKKSQLGNSFLYDQFSALEMSKKAFGKTG